MSSSRYRKTPTVNSGKSFGTSRHSPAIFFAVQGGLLTFTTKKLLGGERLDTVAHTVYGDSGYWWIIASATGIGWPLQVPAGTLLRIPTDLNKALTMAGR